MSSTRMRVSPLPTPHATAAGQDRRSLLENSARRDLAQRLNIAEDEVEVVSIEKMEMPIGSLGCEETSGRRNQGLIIGDEIVLRAQGQEFTYRSDGSRVLPCSPAAFPSVQPTRSAAGSATAAPPSAQDLAVTDLASRLGVAPTAITVRTVNEVEWPDTSLGCPEPGMMYPQVITPGQQIVLEVNGQTYDYRAGQSRVILCLQ